MATENRNPARFTPRSDDDRAERTVLALERIATALERPEREPVVVMFEGTLTGERADRVIQQVRAAWARKYPPADTTDDRSHGHIQNSKGGA